MITADMRGGLFSSKEEERCISSLITTTIAYYVIHYSDLVYFLF